MGTILAAVRGRLRPGLFKFRARHQMICLGLYSAPDDTCPPGHGRLIAVEVKELVQQDGLRLKPGMNATVEPEGEGDSFHHYRLAGCT